MSRPTSPDLPLRWLAALLGFALFVVAVLASLGALFALASGATVPDGYAVSTDFWPEPRSWGEVAGRAARAVAIVWIVGLLFLATTILLRFAFDRSELRLRTALAIPFALAALAAAGLGVGLAVQADSARVRPDCGRFRFDGAAWRSTDRDVWRPQALGVGGCSGLRGATSQQVMARLGRPERTSDRRTLWRYKGGAVVVRFRRSAEPGAAVKRVERTELNPNRAFGR